MFLLSSSPYVPVLIVPSDSDAWMVMHYGLDTIFSYRGRTGSYMPVFFSPSIPSHSLVTRKPRLAQTVVTFKKM